MALHLFYRSGGNVCKECAKAAAGARRDAKREEIRAYDRLRSRRPERYAMQLAHAQAYGKRHPRRRVAYVQLCKAVKEGRIDKPDSCVVCRKKGTIQGHHDDYTRPYDVVWVCPACHYVLDRLRRQDEAERVA